MITYADTYSRGFAEKHRGTRQLRAAANMMVADPSLTMKSVYIDVASMYNTTPTAVEKGIRYAVAHSDMAGTTNTEMIWDLVALDVERKR